MGCGSHDLSIWFHFVPPHVCLEGVGVGRGWGEPLRVRLVLGAGVLETDVLGSSCTWRWASLLGGSCSLYLTLLTETQVSLRLPPRQTQQTDAPPTWSPRLVPGSSPVTPKEPVVLSPGEPRWLCGFVVHPGSREEALGSCRPDGCGYRGALSPSVGQATVPAYPVTLPSSQVSAPRS